LIPEADSTQDYVLGHLSERGKMNKRGVYDLISVFGAIVLFSAWIFQQTSVEKQRAVISNLDQAEREYRQYQSSNALFNALIETQKGNDSAMAGSDLQYRTP